LDSGMALTFQTSQTSHSQIKQFPNPSPLTFFKAEPIRSATTTVNYNFSPALFPSPDPGISPVFCRDGFGQAQ